MAAQRKDALDPVPQSMLVALSALVLALGLHAIFVLQDQASLVEQAGGQTALAAQGNSFVNMAAGVETPVAADAPETQVQTEPVPPLVPPETSPPVAPPAAQPEPDVMQPSPQIETVQGGVPVIAPAPEPEPEPLPVPATPVALVEVSQPVKQAETPDPPVEQMRPAVPVAPKEANPIHLSPLQDLVERVEPDEVQPPEPQSPAVTLSLRPPERPVDPVVRPESEPSQRRIEKPAAQPVPTAQPRGNGQASATRGEVQSTRNAPGGQATRSGGTATVQGNAAVSNYPGQVMRRIQRAKRRANVRGVAVVRFRVTAGGGLTGLSIARSSGSAKLDGIALAQVRRAAPFPPPPAGARTSFTVRIKGN